MPTGSIILALAFQIAAGATADSIMPGLIVNGERYAAALPSLTCDETTISRHVKGDKIKEEVTLQGTMQIQRTSDGQRPFQEQYQWKTRNGQPLAEGKKANAPYVVIGAFANGLGFSSGRRVACFDTTLQDHGPTLLLTLKRKADISANPTCAEVPPSNIRRITVDRATGHVARVEINMNAQDAEERRQPFYAAVDYQPVLLGEETFWLPVSAEAHNPTDDRRMTATYSNCRRFTGSMKIIGNPTVVPD